MTMADSGRSLFPRTTLKLPKTAKCKARGTAATPKQGTRRDEIALNTFERRAPITLWHVTGGADADAIMTGGLYGRIAPLFPILSFPTSREVGR